MNLIVVGTNHKHSPIELRETLSASKRRLKDILLFLKERPGLKGVVVGQGDTYEEALSDVKSAIRFHIESFGEGVLDVEPPILEAFIAEAGIDVKRQAYSPSNDN